MVQKFLAVDPNGSPAAVEVTPNQASAGAGDAGKVVALNAAGQVDQSMMPTGIGPDTLLLPASETLAAGALVNIWNNGGAQNARNADASAANAGKPAHGFVLAGVAANAQALVYFGGEITGLTGLTPGQPMFLSDATPGQMTNVPVTGSGHLLQPVGETITPTSVQVTPGAGVIRA